MMDRLTDRMERGGLIGRNADGGRHYFPGLLSTVGSAAGGLFGGPAGAAIGMGAGKLISQIVGHGDYKIVSNSLVDSQGQPNAQFSHNHGELRIAHREYVGQVVGSSDFSGRRYPINPGLAQLFPSLSRIAQNYTMYQFNGLVFEYRSASGPVSTNTPASGVVMLATQYNPNEARFSNKIQLDGYQYSTSVKPYESCYHPVECDPTTLFTKNHLIRFGSNGIEYGQEPFYDMGWFSIATQGMDSDYDVGELWVTYDITLRMAKIPPVYWNNWGNTASYSGQPGTYLFSLWDIVNNPSYIAAYDPEDHPGIKFTQGGSTANKVELTRVGSFILCVSGDGTGLGGLGYDAVGLTVSNFIMLPNSDGTYIMGYMKLTADTVNTTSNPYVNLTWTGSFANTNAMFAQAAGEAIPSEYPQALVNN
jgi:hypothetical protein